MVHPRAPGITQLSGRHETGQGWSGRGWLGPCDLGPCCRPGLCPYPGDGQSRGSILGRSLASSPAESMDLRKDVDGDPPETTDSSSSTDWDWDMVVGKDSAESSASPAAGVSVMISSGTSSPSCSTLGEGLTICQRRQGNAARAASRSSRAQGEPRQVWKDLKREHARELKGLKEAGLSPFPLGMSALGFLLMGGWEVERREEGPRAVSLVVKFGAAPC